MAAAEVPADQPADTALDIHLPDEVTVEHTKMWHGRFDPRHLHVQHTCW